MFPLGHWALPPFGSLWVTILEINYLAGKGTGYRVKPILFIISLPVKSILNVKGNHINNEVSLAFIGPAGFIRRHVFIKIKR